MPVTIAERLPGWKEGNKEVKAICKHGFQTYLEQLPHGVEAFGFGERVLGCGDGRVEVEPFCLLGSGIILGSEGTVRFCQEIEARHGKIEVVTWHDNCGAAEMRAAQHGCNDPNSFAKQFAEEVAGRIGANTRWVSNHRQSFHHERAVYYDGTGLFNWGRIQGLPVGFTISRAYLDFNISHAEFELWLATKILLGSEGFGNYFTEYNRLLVVLLAENANKFKSIQEEAELVLAGMNRHRINIQPYILDG